ncbi:hypothetical protein [Peribacillus asahii]|uniref:hypothetical protein n=1 Tax=Peribacillus asahii TaxID=228899 RepID=UPI00207A94AE|nr:hypothetical protein [Peribacillus asahii]USK62180.1 hypothetical protein LIT37_23675 [Peribacillus asahii]
MEQVNKPGGYKVGSDRQSGVNTIKSDLKSPVSKYDSMSSSLECTITIRRQERKAKRERSKNRTARFEEKLKQLAEV